MVIPLSTFSTIESLRIESTHPTLNMINIFDTPDIKVKKLTIMSNFQQTCQYFDKDVKKMTLFIAEIAQK